jgi:hypothetical protein
VKSRRALAISGAASAALHAIPLLAMVWTPRIPWPEPPIPVEVRAQRRPPKPAEPPQRGAPPEKEKAAPAKRSNGVAKPKPKPVKEEAPPPPVPPATADLQGFAPGDSKIVVLLRTDRLRKSPHRAGVETLLEALPDYATLLGGTGLTPLDDFDALLIATADPFDVTATFLAARHGGDPRISAALGRRAMPSWDPRVIRHLGPKLSVLTRPDGAAAIDGAGADGGVDDPRGKWLAELSRFDKAADEDGAPSMMVSVSDLGALARFGGGLPTPLAAAIAATADASPVARLRLTFATGEDAQRFEAEWPNIVKRFRSQAILLGLGSMLDGLAAKREGVVVDVSGRIAEAQTRLALIWAKALIPRPAMGEEGADGGVGDGGGGRAPTGTAVGGGVHVGH